MNALLKNWLLQNKDFCFKRKHQTVIIVLLMFSFKEINSQQIANYVNNGGFENLIDCNPPIGFGSKVKYWSGIDITKASFVTRHICLGNIPNTGAAGFQWPKKGNGLIRSTFFCDINFCQPNSRAYFRNKLKSNLVNNTTYCVKFYVNITNPSPFGIDAFGALFSDSNSIDTILYEKMPLTYLTPQIQNPIGNVITDTMNWIPVSGTFIANGTEAFAVIGNFKSDANTILSQIQPSVGYAWCDINLDHVSCIPIDLPAYAGSHTFVVAGDSAYIGRESDIEIDESCIWYKMTSPTTSVSIDTIAGMWVKPVTTTTYVVRQQLWCSGVKWDTVVVSLSTVGLLNLSEFENSISIFPNPANQSLQIEISVAELVEATTLKITNTLGQILREEDILFKDNTISIQTSELKNGIYFLYLSNNKLGSISKRFVIAR